MYTKYLEVYEKTDAVSVLCKVLFTWKRLIGKIYHFAILTVRRNIKHPRTSRERKFNFLLRYVSACQVPNIFCHSIRTVQNFSDCHYFIFILNAKKRTSSTMPFGYGKIMIKRNKKGIHPRRKWKVKNMNKQ